WMAENLNYEADGSVCYNNSESNCNTYGRLYNWTMAMGLNSSCNSTSCVSQVQSKHQGICPSGWHIPSNAEWDKLYSYAAGNVSNCVDEGRFGYCPTAGTKLKAANGWNDYAGIPAGTDDFGFSALPGGYDGSTSFPSVGYHGYWWSSGEFNSDYAYRRSMGYSSESAGWDDYYKTYLFSVRCLQDK
ncbi:MAG: hypothetical protein FWC26_03510, partial [Fibromonadales bacterium]|nr:hypothetical protein [Fibromonadales bacterium]